MLNGEDIYQEGRDGLHRGDFEAAAAAFKRCLDDHPDHVSALRGLGACLDGLGQYEEATECKGRAARLALALDPPELDLNLANGWLEAARSVRASVPFPVTAAADGGALIFHHICNTWGTTLRNVIEGIYHPSQVHLGIGQAQEEYEKAFRDFTELPNADKVAKQLIWNNGHAPYHLGLPGRCAHATMLRHPVEQIKSRYFHWYVGFRRKLPGHGDSRFEPLNDDFRLRRFVDTLRERRSDNMAARWLAVLNFTDQDGETSYRNLPDDRNELSDLAFKVLEEKLSFVGITERFDETCLALAVLLGFDHVPFWKFGMDQKFEMVQIPYTVDLDPAVVCEIERINGIDMALYEECRRRFEENFAPLISFFEDNLGSLREGNHKKLISMVHWCPVILE